MINSGSKNELMPYFLTYKTILGEGKGVVISCIRVSGNDFTDRIKDITLHVGW